MLGIGGFYLGWYGGHWVVAGSRSRASTYFGSTDQNDVSMFLGYILGVVGFLLGLGFGIYPFARLRGYPASLREKEEGGFDRYFALSTDHKVVGMQYFVGIGVFFFVAGLNAMLIRVELLRPEPNVWPAGNYLTLVTEHGTMMMGMMTSGILGPFANYLLPLMIGARRMAFPRIEALTFWLLMCGRGDPDRARSSSAASRPAGRATSRSTLRRTWAWTRTSCSSRSSGCRCRCSG